MLQTDVLLNFCKAYVVYTSRPRTRKIGKEELWTIEGSDKKWKRNNE
jgi:hypothetical protein